MNKNQLLRSSIIVFVRLVILVMLVFVMAIYLEDFIFFVASAYVSEFFSSIGQFFLYIYKYYVVVLIASFVLCLDIWRRKIHTQKYLKRAYILLTVIRGLEYFMWIFWLYIFILAGHITNNCIVEGEPILTPSGTVAIQEILTGDEIWTLSPEGKLEVGKVITIQKFQAQAFFKINLVSGQELNVTGTHPIATTTGWKQAKDIQNGDLVQIIVNNFSEVLSVKIVHQKVNIYAISVDNHKNFFVNGILVHNKSPI